MANVKESAGKTNSQPRADFMRQSEIFDFSQKKKRNDIQGGGNRYLHYHGADNLQALWRELSALLIKSCEQERE